VYAGGSDSSTKHLYKIRARVDQVEFFIDDMVVPVAVSRLHIPRPYTELYEVESITAPNPS
jgi:hypothetical protein